MTTAADPSAVFINTSLRRSSEIAHTQTLMNSFGKLAALWADNARAPMSDGSRPPLRLKQVWVSTARPAIRGRRVVPTRRWPVVLARGFGPLSAAVHWPMRRFRALESWIVKEPLGDARITPWRANSRPIQAGSAGTASA